MDYSKETLTEMAHELGEAIKLSEEYIHYQTVKAIYEADKDLQTLIGEFNLEKMAVMNEMQKEDSEKDEDLMKKHQDAMRKVYAELMKNPVMTDFNNAKNELEGMVNKLYEVINYYVTGKEPGCTGSCDTCGGCH